jgi:hypothetical protein
MQLDINTDAVVKFTAKLERISKSAMPQAVRFALNSAAFDVKTNTMPSRAGDAFEKRQPNFFRANSRVERAAGLDVNSMRATVGFVSENLQGKSNYSVKDLEQQEYGGSIGGRSFIPLAGARVGGNYRRAVRPGNRISAINKIIEAKKSKGRTAAQRFRASAVLAGLGGYVLASRTLYRIDSGRTDLAKRETRFKVTPLYSYKKGRKAGVKATRFMRTASLQSAAKLESYFIEEAKKRIGAL